MARTAATRLVSSRWTHAGCAGLLLLGLTGCGEQAPAADRTSSAAATVSTPAAPVTSPSPLAEPVTTAAPEATPVVPAPPSPPGPVAGPLAEPLTGPVTAPGGPLALPPGPALPPVPAPPPAPGSLASLDWGGRDHPAACASPQVGAAVAGDLDGDRVDEVAVPVSCPDGAPSSVLVYAGDAAAPRLLGDALPAQERARVQAVEVRDGHLVVGAFTWKDAPRSGEPDTAVTTRWVVQGDRLVRTDRWEDPAHLLEVDEED